MTAPRARAVAAALALGLWIPPAGAAEPVPVAPGGVVRWAGDATVTECSALGRSWFPLAGDCFYPVDLTTPEGEIALAREHGGVRETATVRVGAYPYPEQHLTVDERMVELSPEDRARADRERAAVETLWGRRGPARFTLPLHSPLVPRPEGGSFGSRRTFNGQPRSPHTGVDYRAPRGTPVKAAADGGVALAADHFFAGRSVYLDHGGGLITMYFHLDEIRVAEGEEVRRGQVIGTVGATGRATGPHLHFGVRWLGARVDPELLLASPTRLPTASD